MNETSPVEDDSDGLLTVENLAIIYEYVTGGVALILGVFFIVGWIDYKCIHKNERYKPMSVLVVMMYVLDLITGLYHNVSILALLCFFAWLSQIRKTTTNIELK